MLHGTEICTAATLEKITAFEIWMYRRVLNVSWTDKISNKKILAKIMRIINDYQET